MPQWYTVIDKETGDEVDFYWKDPVNPPTEADLEKVIQAYRLQRAAETPSAPAGQDAQAGEGRTPHPLDISNPESGIRRAARAVGQFINDNPGTVGAMVGGALVAPFTAGASLLPAAAALAGGAAAGSVAGNLVDTAIEQRPVDAGKLAREAAVEGALSGGIPVVGRVIGAIGRAGVASALKNVDPRKVADLVQTAVKEGITPGRRGFLKADRRIAELNKKVQQIIDGIESGSVSVPKALRGLDALKKRELASGATEADIRAIDELKEFYSKAHRQTLTASEAQRLKSGLMRRADKGKAYADPTAGAKAKAQKEFASGLRQQIEELDPTGGQIRALNAREGRLIELRDAMQTTPDSIDPVIRTATWFGGPKAAAIHVGLRPQFQAAVGRRLARIGQALDPSYYPGRTPRLAASHPAREVTLDTVGVPVESPEPYVRDILDRLDIPVQREVLDADELWYRRILPQKQAQIQHLPLQAEREAAQAAAEQGTYHVASSQVPVVQDVTPLTRSGVTMQLEPAHTSTVRVETRFTPSSSGGSFTSRPNFDARDRRRLTRTDFKALWKRYQEEP